MQRGCQPSWLRLAIHACNLTVQFLKEIRKCKQKCDGFLSTQICEKQRFVLFMKDVLFVKRAQEITYRFFFLRSKSPLGPAVDEGGGIPGCDIPMLMLSPEDVGIILENKVSEVHMTLSLIEVVHLIIKNYFQANKDDFLLGTIDKFHKFKVEPGAMSIHKLKQFSESIQLIYG